MKESFCLICYNASLGASAFDDKHIAPYVSFNTYKMQVSFEMSLHAVT